MDRAGKLPVDLSSRGMFSDQRADALDRAEQITDGLIWHDDSSPFFDFIIRDGSPTNRAQVPPPRETVDSGSSVPSLLERAGPSARCDVFSTAPCEAVHTRG